MYRDADSVPFDGGRTTSDSERTAHRPAISWPEDRDSKRALWEKVQKIIKRHLGQRRYSIWFEQTELMSISGSKAVVGVPNVVIQQYLQCQYRTAVQGAVKDLADCSVEVTFDVAPRLFRKMRAEQKKVLEEAQKESLPAVGPGGLQGGTPGTPAGGLGSLFVTASNQLPYMAAREIALGEHPRFNFLLICGDHGMGKSAFLKAILAERTARDRFEKCHCATAEDWCNEYYDSLQNKQTRSFRKRCRGCQVLLIDDVQFFVGKPGAQDELLHTLKSILAAGGRVVLASALDPAELTGLKPALKALLQGAFWAKLVLPPVGERQQIVEELDRRLSLGAKEDVHRFIAETHNRNILELESAAKSLATYAELVKSPEVDLPLAVRAFAAMRRRRESPVDMADIEKIVLEHFSLVKEQLHGARCSRSVAHSRQIAMYMARQLTGATLTAIGRHFGGRTHSTVKYAVDKIAAEREKDPGTCALLEGLTGRVRSL